MSGNRSGTAVKEPVAGELYRHTTIRLRKNTKKGLDRNRAPGQCYDGFVSQLIELWERINEES